MRGQCQSAKSTFLGVCFKSIFLISPPIELQAGAIFCHVLANGKVNVLSWHGSNCYDHSGKKKCCQDLQKSLLFTPMGNSAHCNSSRSQMCRWLRTILGYSHVWAGGVQDALHQRMATYCTSETICITQNCNDLISDHKYSRSRTWIMNNYLGIVIPRYLCRWLC